MAKTPTDGSQYGPCNRQYGACNQSDTRECQPYSTCSYVRGSLTTRALLEGVVGLYPLFPADA
jgi:hypothetical protein